jgi:hypothetical protein
VTNARPDNEAATGSRVRDRLWSNLMTMMMMVVVVVVVATEDGCQVQTLTKRSSESDVCPKSAGEEALMTMSHRTVLVESGHYIG